MNTIGYAESPNGVAEDVPIFLHRRAQLPLLIKSFVANPEQLFRWRGFVEDWSSRGMFHFQEKINGRWRASTLVAYWLHPAFYGVHEDAGFCSVNQGFWTSYVRRIVPKAYAEYRAEIGAAFHHEGGEYRSIPPWKGLCGAPFVLVRTGCKGM